MMETTTRQRSGSYIDKLFVCRTPSCALLDVPSNSVTGLVAASRAVLKEEEVLVDKAVRDAYVHRLACSATLPNSTYKKPPSIKPPPEKTWNELMQKQAIAGYGLVYNTERNPQPQYPIVFIPPSHPVRPPPPPPPPPPRGKDKDGKDAKGRKKGKK